MYTKPKVKNNCTFVVQQMISAFWKPIPFLMSCIKYILYLLRTVFSRSRIYFYLSWSRRYYTIIFPALLSRMGGAVWHYDGSELSSVISVLVQCWSRTSEVQVYCHCIWCVWETIASIKKNIVMIMTFCLKIFFFLYSQNIQYIHFFHTSVQDKMVLWSSSNWGNCLLSEEEKSSNLGNSHNCACGCRFRCYIYTLMKVGVHFTHWFPCSIGTYCSHCHSCRCLWFHWMCHSASQTGLSPLRHLRDSCA